MNQTATTQTKVALLALVALAAGGGCRTTVEKNSQWVKPAFNKYVQKAVRSPTGNLDVREQLKLDWDRMIVLPPHISPEETQKRLGFKWEGAQKSASQMVERYVQLVFVKDQAVVAAFDFERSRVDFEPLVEKGYIPRADAVFVLRL